jgi:predicted adenine nucleotide alpha hydrolase (AANH) superfamily ATPase
MIPKKLLLHTCCAPCSVKCIDSLVDVKPALFWYNPNIHPYTEYRERRDTLVKFAAYAGLDLISDDEYGLRLFLRGIYAGDAESNITEELQAKFPADDTPMELFQADARSQRCVYCYRLRLEKTAVRAAADGYDCFSTTLLISPYQNHDLIRQIGEELGETYGVKFLYRDFRPLFRAGQTKARELGLYMQKYCGCIFSEEERYIAKGEPKMEKVLS